MRRLAEDVEHVADAVALRIDEVEALFVEVGLQVADVIERGDDEIDRHDVDPPALEPDARHPRRQDLPHALDHFEEVVRPVDLVHLAGSRVAGDHRRAVHRPRQLGFLAHDFFALVLGHEVRVIQALGLVEHVFAEHAFVQAGRSDRADVVQVAGIDRLRELDRIARAFDVDLHLRLFVGREVVDRGEVVQVIDLPLQLLDVVGRDAELLRREVAEDRTGARLRDAPVGEQVVDLAFALGSQQKVHRRSTALQQRLDESFADEAGGAGDEILHASSWLCAVEIRAAHSGPKLARHDFVVYPKRQRS